MFPIRDDNPTLRTPVITIAIIAANVIAWVVVQGFGRDQALVASVCELGLVPGAITGRARTQAVELAPGILCALEVGPRWYTLVTSMFMHGSWIHILGNMWFLWIFGNNVEDAMGRARFLVFY